MNKKFFVLILFLVSILLLMLSIPFFRDNDAKLVKEIPPGFIQLPKGGSWDNSLHYVPWESQIAFLDDNENCIYQTGFDNSDFIVKYKNEYYVNEEKILELIDVANSQHE